MKEIEIIKKGFYYVSVDIVQKVYMSLVVINGKDALEA
jgi:hypothetical protein